jgi:lysozyme
MTDPRRPFADALRNAGLDFNRTGVVAAFDALMDKAGIAKAVAAPSGMRTGAAGIALMKEFEGYARVLPGGRVQAYQCPAKVWTIGFGSTGVDPFNGGQIRQGTIWTDAQALERFRQHLAEFEREVNRAVTAPTTQNQFDAMVSLVYNIGAGAFRGSTLLRLHNGRNYAAAEREFARWNRAGGKVLAGLTRRRAAEAALYRKP